MRFKDWLLNENDLLTQNLERAIFNAFDDRLTTITKQPLPLGYDPNTHTFSGVTPDSIIQ
jgi:hypothetical protein